jgi:predicted double-glycine peptidase
MADLEGLVRRRTPVIVTYQAWREDKKASTPWSKEWDSGHYSIVVGMDKDNIYLEDPVLLGSIGYLPRHEFEERWHDTDRKGRKYHRLGIAFGAGDPVVQRNKFTLIK